MVEMQLIYVKQSQRIRCWDLENIINKKCIPYFEQEFIIFVTERYNNFVSSHHSKILRKGYTSTLAGAIPNIYIAKDARCLRIFCTLSFQFGVTYLFGRLLSYIMRFKNIVANYQYIFCYVKSLYLTIKKLCMI